jgi:hypothetical protein
MPRNLAPGSTPKLIFSTFPPLNFLSLITKGVFVMTFAAPVFKSLLALDGRHGISGLPFLSKTKTDDTFFDRPSPEGELCATHPALESLDASRPPLEELREVFCLRSLSL